MTDTAVSQVVYRLYRLHRKTNSPLAAMHQVRGAFAEAIARDAIMRDRDPNPFDRQSWLYADQLVDIIMARRGRPSFAGRYWATGVQHHERGCYRVLVDFPNGRSVGPFCRTLACAIRRGMNLIGYYSGQSFTVTDRRGRVYIDNATELSTMGELFDQARTVRA